MKETVNENTRKEVIKLLKKVATQCAQKIDELMDTVHQVGRKEEKRMRQVIIHFLKRQHRDAIWRMTRELALLKIEPQQMNRLEHSCFFWSFVFFIFYCFSLSV